MAAAAAHICCAQAGASRRGRGGVEEEAEDQAEKRHQQIGDGRGEIALQFFLAMMKMFFIVAVCLSVVTVFGRFLGLGQLQEDVFQLIRRRRAAH